MLWQQTSLCASVQSTVEEGTTVPSSTNVKFPELVDANLQIYTTFKI